MLSTKDSESTDGEITWAPSLHREVSTLTTYPVLSLELRSSLMQKVTKLDNDCWVSTQKQYQLRGVRYALKPLLFKAVRGFNPLNYLFPVCSTPGCINPNHQRDGSDREEADMKQRSQEERDIHVLENMGLTRESCYNYGVVSRKDAGMTRYFDCYSCNKSFDPTKSRNDVICDSCQDGTQTPTRHTTALDGVAEWSLR